MTGPTEFTGFEEIAAAVQRRLENQPQVVLAIDGRCGAGKSTFAGLLAARLGGRVARADDFFLRPEQRTPQRLEQPGGNIDYERMKAELIDCIAPGELCYTPFDCSVWQLGQPICLPPARLTIVEGAYSLHPYFGRYWDLAVFITADVETRLERIAARKGHNNVEMFRTRWIPLEERYLAACGVEQKADFIVNTGR